MIGKQNKFDQNFNEIQCEPGLNNSAQTTLAKYNKKEIGEKLIPVGTGDIANSCLCCESSVVSNVFILPRTLGWTTILFEM